VYPIQSAVKRRKQAAFNMNFLNHGFFVRDGSVRHHSISGDQYGPCVNDNQLTCGSMLCDNNRDPKLAATAFAGSTFN